MDFPPGQRCGPLTTTKQHKKTVIRAQIEQTKNERIAQIKYEIHRI